MNSHQWQQHVTISFQTSARESAFFVMFGRDPINKLNMLLHAARRYFHDDNGLPNLEVLKNIYQVVAQQLLNSRERYVKKHHNQQRSESPVQAGDLILIKDNSQKLRAPVQRDLQSGEGLWQQCRNSRLQRQHLDGARHRREEDYTDGTGC